MSKAGGAFVRSYLSLLRANTQHKYSPFRRRRAGRRAQHRPQHRPRRAQAATLPYYPLSLSHTHHRANINVLLVEADAGVARDAGAEAPARRKCVARRAAPKKVTFPCFRPLGSGNPRRARRRHSPRRSHRRSRRCRTARRYNVRSDSSLMLL
jgi:hypothetical protein